MLKKNGYVLEQLLSPLVVHTTPEHEELKAIARAASPGTTPTTTWGSPRRSGSCSKGAPAEVKPLLYVYRVLLTGIHLMRTGEVEANLLRLNEPARLPYIAELVERKLAGGERSRLADADLAFHQREYERLTAELEQAFAAEPLARGPVGSGGPERPAGSLAPARPNNGR